MIIRIAPHVQKSLDNKLPIVALESTIISHGMPFPTNLETARSLEKIIFDNGATPATIGIIDGDIVVGLSEKELQILANPESNTYKAATKDLGFVHALKRNGGTTVSATMFIAAKVGIHVFATGGIGGVHRGVQETSDISSDLIEFTQSPVVVVSAGCKAILDIPRTLEHLETIGVTVAGFQCQEFPAFYSRTSGQKVQQKFETLEQIAGAFAFDRLIGRRHGILVANPIPAHAEIPAKEVDAWITEALAELQNAQVSGKEVTPFLLSFLGKKSEGKTLAANIALVQNNAQVAAKLASAIAAAL
jgi:pseudouridine-5'-phosphate glycosidase